MKLIFTLPEPEEPFSPDAALSPPPQADSTMDMTSILIRGRIYFFLFFIKDDLLRMISVL
ncbi:hypothetical protein D3C73_1338970 [compost metagenome]